MAAGTALKAVFDVPKYGDVSIITGSATGTINRGDWLVFSGNGVVASNSGHTAYWKASGAGVALEGSPTYDQAGRSVTNTAMPILTQGVLRVSGAQSGNPTLGLGAFPVSTGSAVDGVTGLTGVAATWTALAPVAASGATAAAYHSPVAKIIGVYNPGQTAQLDILLTPIRPDIYG